MNSIFTVFNILFLRRIKMRKFKTEILCMLVLALAATSLAKESAEDKKENPYLWKAKVKSVTVFKNDLGFFLREGQTELRDGWCVSGAIPPASFGTLVIFPTDANKTVDIVGTGNGDTVEFDGVDAPDEIAVKRSRLQSCMYLKVQLFYKDNKKSSSAAGKVVSVGTDYVILDAENSNFAVPLEGITKLVVLENPLRVHVTSDDKKPAAKTTLGMAYLRKGITWVPEYTMKLLNEDTAELTLKGTLINEAEDLINCDVQLVVGVPHFVHTDYLTPISVGQVIRTIGTAIAPTQVSQQIANRATVAFDNSIRSNQIDVISQPVTDSSGHTLQNTTGNLPKLESEGATDYTVYERKGVTLRVGEKAILTLFTKKIKYRHSYRWQLPSDIEHFLILENNTDSAFTTGPCLVLSDNRALSEDLLKYIPKGGSGEIPVTTAINIAKDQKEKETARELKRYNVNRYYDLVTLSGELKLRNFDSKNSEINVAMKITGEPISTSDDADIVMNTDNLKLMERTATVTWQMTLKPGETKTLTYSYKRYVPSE
jgi:hypothetical protein